LFTVEVLEDEKDCIKYTPGYPEIQNSLFGVFGDILKASSEVPRIEINVMEGLQFVWSTHSIHRIS
jgi:hypothetical protein